MLSIRKVLFPVDFSHLCETVADAVHGLARRTGATVTLLHAAREKAGADAQLHAFRKELWDPVRTAYVIEQGDPISATLQHIELTKPDLVMLATHGNDKARRILQEAPCPVWVDGPRQKFGPRSRDAVDHVYYLADSSDERVGPGVLLDWASAYAKIWNARVDEIRAECLSQPVHDPRVSVVVAGRGTCLLNYLGSRAHSTPVIAI